LASTPKRKDKKAGRNRAKKKRIHFDKEFKKAKPLQRKHKLRRNKPQKVKVKENRKKAERNIGQGAL
jgi:hypothetical protein